MGVGRVNRIICRAFRLDKNIRKGIVGKFEDVINTYGLRMDESARRKVYSTVNHCATAWPSLIAGLNFI